nr:A kinase anchor protein 17A [Hymenolepis microstoma]
MQRLVKLSSLGTQSKSLSTWEVSEKVTGVTVDFVRFLVELKSRSDVKRVVKAADSQCIKLRGFPQTLRVRTGEAPIDCPRKHDWDAFFRDSKDMNELIPGERPDTIVLSQLPPDPKILVEVFQAFGKIRRVDIPILDPCQNHRLLDDMGLTLDDAKDILSGFHTSVTAEDNPISNQSVNHNGFEESSSSVDSAYPLTFTAYIQFVDYAGFTAAMEALRGKKLIYAPGDINKKQPAKFYSAEIKVDFDRTKHLSDASIRRRRAAQILLESASRKKAEAMARAAEEAARREAEFEAARLAEEERVRAEKEAALKRAEEEARIRAAEKRLRREEKRRRAEEARRAREAEEKKRILHKRLKREMAKLKARKADEEARERKRHKHRHHCHQSRREKAKGNESDYYSETNSIKTHSSIAIQTSPDKLLPPFSPSSAINRGQSKESDTSIPPFEFKSSSPDKEGSSLHIQRPPSRFSRRSRSSSSSASRDRSSLNSEEEVLRRKLIAKREAQLRAQILARLGR